MTSPTLYTSDFVLNLDAEGYHGGAEGVATMTFRHPVKVTKLVAKCKAHTFMLTNFTLVTMTHDGRRETVDLFELTGEFYADVFFEDVPCNAFSAPTLVAGEPVTIKFRDIRASTLPEKLELIVTVRSKVPREELVP